MSVHAVTGREGVVIALQVIGDIRAWAVTIDSVAATGYPVVLGIADDDAVDALGTNRGARCLRSSSIADLLALLAAEQSVRWIIAVGEAAAVPSTLPERLEDFTDERYATVSFLSNAAGHLSFPHPGTPVPWILGGGTADSVTALLRSAVPLPEPAIVPAAGGAVVAVSADVVRLLPGSWARGVESFAEAMLALSLASQARGLINLLDTTTFVHRLSDLQPIHPLDTAARARLRATFPWFDTALEISATDPDSPMRLEHRLARVTITGLDILMDGSCLGPLEMGTQVGLIAICMALAERDDVASIVVTLPGDMPSYARELAMQAKVSFLRPSPNNVLETERRFDVAYRAFQPDESFDVDVFRARASRVIVSILDLIAFQNGAYFNDGEAWRRYRSTLRRALPAVDGVTTISSDVIGAVEMERLPVAPHRLFPLPYGTGHIGRDAATTMPRSFASNPAARFLLCLGTNYGHKNRDIAIRATNELRRRGHEVDLVLAGPGVPFGSSRLHEVEALGEHRPMLLADVSAAERNWLLSHAEVVLYPTSAEGFGLVPYEAAAMGTPTVFVPFGPLAEIAGDIPGCAREWSPGSFADAVEELLVDPDLGWQQVEALDQAAGRYTWEATAERLVQIMRQVLAQPAIR
jgi:glycosyltransferase involved in cell wall biosynthesis